MAALSRFQLGGLVLKVNEDAYLVEVESSDISMAQRNDLADLPRWVFESRHAIWLSAQSGPLNRRAFEGEMFKKKLMRL